MKLLLLAVSGSLLLSSCDSDKPTASRADTLFRGCASDSECPGGVCLHVDASASGMPARSFCTFDCSDDDECSASEFFDVSKRSRQFFSGVCSTVANRRLCLPSCKAAGVPYFACVQDETRLCSELDDSYCADCGCAQGMFCVQGSGCEAPRTVGEPCRRHAECASNNCSELKGICRVALFAPCDADNCDYCMRRFDAPNYCTRDCRGIDGNPDCDGHMCARPADQEDYPQRCWPPCAENGAAPCISSSCYRDYGPPNSAITYGYSCFCPTNCQQIESVP